MTINKNLLIEDIKKLPGLLMAFFICAYGIAQMKALNIGMNPWDTFNLGIAYKMDLEFGKVTQAVGFMIILLSLTVKIYPGIGTICNMYFLGLFIDMIDRYRLTIIPENSILKIFALIWGLVILCYGVYSYLKFELGAGPRDGLIIGLVQMTGISVTYVKTTIEGVVLVAGFLLGGTVGLGTVIATFCGGYILDKIFQWKNFNPKKTKQRKFTDYVIMNKNKDQVKS